MMGVQMAFDVTGDPAFPEKAAFEVARDLGIPVTTHAGVWGATSDTGIQQMYDGGFMTPETTYVHASTLTRDSYQRIAATGGSISVATESECSAGQGHAPTEQVLQYGIPVSLSMDTSVWWSGDMFSAMRATLNADRMAEHLDAHLKGETITHLRLRAQQVVEWCTRGGAHTIGRDSDLGSLEAGKKADVVLIKNDASLVSFPLLNPLGHVVFQAQRGDVHTVVVDGRVVKYDGRLVGIDLARLRAEVEDTIDHLKGALGEETWQAGMFPEKPEAEASILDNPYQYTDFKDESKRAGGEDRVLGR
jgi:cytosine/adenosine deaminase-related metal-dependent hydrolase